MATKRQNNVQEKLDPPQKLSDSMFFGLHLDDDQQKFVDGVWKREKKVYLINSVAGTGKTLLSVALGVLMVKYGIYEKIVYVTFPGIYEKTQGFLPGDLIEKSDPYFQPLRDALVEIGEMPDKVCNTNPVAVKNGTAYVECAVSTYMRGINLKDAFVIIDEAENADIETLAKVISRINDSCLCVIIGHSGQCDMYDKSKSGFTACIDYYTKYQPELCEKYELYTNHRGWISQLADTMLQLYDKPAFGFIYMTRNNITGKLYIGKHRRTMDTEDIDDSWYLGSGRALKEAIIQYGRENFDRRIIYECQSQSELDYMERVFIAFYDAVDDEQFYNIIDGRNWDTVFTEEVRQKMRKPHKEMSAESKSHMRRKFSQETRDKLAESARKNLTGYVHSDESRKNMSDGHRGSCSIFRDGKFKYIKKEQLQEYLDEGWILKGSRSGYRWMHNGVKGKQVSQDSVQAYLNSGWTLGKLPTKRKKTVTPEDVSTLGGNKGEPQ